MVLVSVSSRTETELSTGRMDPRVRSGRVGSGWVMILPDFGESGSEHRVFEFFYYYFLLSVHIVLCWQLEC